MVVHKLLGRALAPLPGELTERQAKRLASQNPLSAAQLFAQVNPVPVIRLLRDTLLAEGFLRPARVPLLLSLEGAQGLILPLDPDELVPTEGTSPERAELTLRIIRGTRLQVGPVIVQGHWEAEAGARLGEGRLNGLRVSLSEAEGEARGPFLILDGHHRTEAAKRLGTPVLAWVVSPGSLNARPLHRIYPRGVRFAGRRVPSPEDADGPVFFDGRRFYELPRVPELPALRYTPDLEEALKNPPAVIMPKLRPRLGRRLPHKALSFSPKPPAGAAMMLL